jgi:hypothetical protein
MNSYPYICPYCKWGGFQEILSENNFKRKSEDFIQKNNWYRNNIINKHSFIVSYFDGFYYKWNTESRECSRCCGIYTVCLLYKIFEATKDNFNTITKRLNRIVLKSKPPENINLFLRNRL